MGGSLQVVLQKKDMFTWKPEAPKELPECLDKDKVSEVMKLNESFKNCFVKIFLLSQIISYSCFV